MGVRVIDTCDSCDEDSCYSCSCSSPTISTNSKNSTATTTTANQQKYQNPKTEIKPEINTNNTSSLPANFTLTTKDLVGNCKEFRIENNKTDLRIIGNGNRIRILNNTGNLYIIGNATRLKIIHNSGHIKYTGNDGRIYLGSESKQQLIDYIGCNGILKVINSLELYSSSSKGKCKVSKKSKCNKDAAADSSSNTNNAETIKPKKLKVKSASFGGIVSDSAGNIDFMAQWQQFNAAFQRSSPQHLSLPDILSSSNAKFAADSKCKSKTTPKVKKSKTHCNVSNNVSIVSNVGNIVIRNSVNISV